jgi:microcompartment protein CcmL/EutN
MIFGPAITAFEISSIALGYTLVDKAVKKAPVKILEGAPLTPGKFFILLNGDEASIEECRAEIKLLVGQNIIDEVYIPQLHPEVLPALYSQSQFKVDESLAIVETTTIAAGFLSADQAVKNSNVHLIDFRIARGIGGKSYFFITGKLEEVTAGVESATAVLTPRGTLLRTEVIANPHPDFLQHFFN